MKHNKLAYIPRAKFHGWVSCLANSSVFSGLWMAVSWAALLNRATEGQVMLVSHFWKGCSFPYSKTQMIQKCSKVWTSTSTKICVGSRTSVCAHIYMGLWHCLRPLFTCLMIILQRNFFSPHVSPFVYNFCARFPLHMHAIFDAKCALAHVGVCCGLNIFYVVHLLCFPRSGAWPRCPTNCWGWLGPEQASWHPEPEPRAILTRTNPKFTHYFNPVSFHTLFGYIWFCPNNPVSLVEKRKLLNISSLVMHTQTAWICFTCLGTESRKALVWTRPCQAASWGGPLWCGRMLCSDWLRGGHAKLVRPIWGCCRLAPRVEAEAGWDLQNPLYLAAHHYQNCCLLFMQAPVKPGYWGVSALWLPRQPWLPQHLFYEP